jgi:hypothetical protein
MLLWTPLAQAQTPFAAAPAGDAPAFVLLSSAWLAAPAALDRLAVGLDDAPLALSVYPNPATDAATVRFTLDRTQRVSMDLFDLLGRQVRQRDLGLLQAGDHEVALDLRNLPAGLYIVRLTGDAGARATVRVTRAISA